LQPGRGLRQVGGWSHWKWNNKAGGSGTTKPPETTAKQRRYATKANECAYTLVGPERAFRLLNGPLSSLTSFLTSSSFLDKHVCIIRNESFNI
jgi:hypothetical protein